MMLHTMGFRAVTGQGDVPVAALQPLTADDIETKMVESFSHEMKDDPFSGKKARLQEEEVKKMAAVVLAGLDVGDPPDGKVAAEEFVEACSSSEFISTTTFMKFIDEDRKLGILERFLDPTRAEVNLVHRRMKQREEIM